ncbi:MAG: hypothetical protein PHY34_00470 [Patescibacteria group bacterium]|nr:hypothetical protein [Patescibacteria group bacterium]MDD5715897.1 hypothetical protein [Patescibacteria group bacterium]
MKRRRWALVGAVVFVVALGLFQGCGDSEQVVEPTLEDTGQSREVRLAARPPNCSWWESLGRAGRNRQIVLEALYSVDQQIWDQNDRVTCEWEQYILGVWGCYVPGDWDYSNRSTIPGYSGECKLLTCELLERASGGAASLPGGTYDYRDTYPWRNRGDGIRYAQPGEVMQFTGTRQHTAVIITNFHDGRFEVVDGNYCVRNRIAKHVINVNTGKEKTADLKFYVIDNCLTDEE